jgi:hypothetical protein
MHKYYLARDVHVCKIGAAAIFLDLRSNAYIAIPPQCMAELDESIAGFVTLVSNQDAYPHDLSPSDPVTPSLLSRGMLTKSGATGTVASQAFIPASQALPPGLGRRASRAINPATVAHFTAALFYVLVNLRLKRLPAIVNRTRALHARNLPALPSDGTDAVSDAVEHFRQMRTMVYTAYDACLFDSLVLTHFLHRHGFSPTFVIGVRIKPFSAHAWVQVGDCVLDERLEAVQTLTPILVV